MLEKEDILLAFGSSLKAYVVADENSDEEKLFEALADAYYDYAASQDWEPDIMKIIAKIYLERDCNVQSWRRVSRPVAKPPI